jgi:hypothetical protein
MEQFQGVITSNGKLVILAPEREANIDHYRGILAELELPSDIEHDAELEIR